jgi:hypothetical protein
LSAVALVRIPVGVVVERRKAVSPWVDYLWRPISALAGEPTAAPWTLLSSEGDVATYYAGSAVVELFRTETANYLGNLASGEPSLWVVLRPTGGEPPYEVFAVTADPAEGEAFTEPGSDLVDTVPMPGTIVEAIEAFVAEHHVERPFYKRPRQRADPDSLARRPRTSEDEA